jgi:hypothetical protein
MPNFFAQLRTLFSDEASTPADAHHSTAPGGFINEDERARQAAPHQDSAPPAYRGSFDGGFGESDGPSSSALRQNRFSRDDFAGPGRFF